MVERDDKLIIGKLEDETKRFNYLSSSLEQFVESEENCSKNTNASFDNLRRLYDKDNTTIQKMYNTLINSIDKIDKNRKLHITKLNTQIIPSVQYYPKKIKEFKQKLNEIDKTKKSVEKMNEELTNAKKKMEQDKIRDINTKINDTNREHSNKNSDFENKIAEFEAERIDDNKCILLHFIHSELAFHSKCMEELSKLYGDINIYEPKGELCEFIKKYNILKNINEEQFSQRYNFTPGVTDRKSQSNQNNAGKKPAIKKTSNDREDEI